MLVGPKVQRAHPQRELARLAEAMGCPVVLQPAAKGCFPEDHSQFAGVFWGQVSTLAADAIVNWADQTQALLSATTTVFVDTGDSWFNGSQLRLPRGPEFEIEMQWGHIGWSIPASFGYALSKPHKRTIVLIGDGAF
ncbi:thiamine pyrophosphate enzyme, central domain-containing protein [Hirsutella rhossiliensis]|uniref:Pyruvate decarboxylase n=1 Tax=Hirsutella rhossiliensis TaxID=111463 RepID=A0A9P8MUM0_9HYPO|nr:thiamine pyrophosphate enzyme, central domain-containing protein [Hirsutella rhossiliensis]KAH0961525.1 thiamine pyrophosphate enzyme, central domain-containing protein [Hirsutella rhossiliensis]